jgi:RimJ/RimL family protein N-acetyltransferase/acyl dehydratase
MAMHRSETMSWTRTFTIEDVRAFGQLSGDLGAHHIEADEEGRLMVQGLLTATLPTKIGGEINFIAKEMRFRFHRPVYSGDTVRCDVAIDELIEEYHDYDRGQAVRLLCSWTCTNQDGKIVLTGEASGLVRAADHTARQRRLMAAEVQLREVAVSDLTLFFEHQLDEEATRMAGFPARDINAFMIHWERIIADGNNVIRTILVSGQVAGNIVGFRESQRTFVGYWLDKAYWGKGIATEALRQFLEVVEARPIFAYVARHNLASIRVLQKCGFAPASDAPQAGAAGEQSGEILFRLELL